MGFTGRVYPWNFLFVLCTSDKPSTKELYLLRLVIFVLDVATSQT